MSLRLSSLKKYTLSLIKHQQQRRGIKWFATPNSQMAKPKQADNVEYTRLPKMVVPQLHSSLNKYLQSLKPILSADDYLRTERCVKEFMNPSSTLNGYRLQDVLINMSQRKHNWASDVYVDENYFKVKLPLPIYSNPAKLMKKQNFKDENSFLKYVTVFINAVLDFKLKIDTNTLETDKSTGYDKTQDLCMDQYKKIFNSYRQPGLIKDKFLIFKNDYSNQHIIVISKNQFYKIDLIVNSQLINELDLFNQLMYIRQESKCEQDSLNTGLLTSLPRDEWALVKQNLVKDPVNRQSFELIEKSAFVVCLDDKVETKKYANEDIKNGNQILNGCGSLFNSGNRWFDKTLQFVISEDGVSGLVREHSPSEGPITVNLIDHVYDYLNNSQTIDTSEIYPFSKPAKLEWNSDAYIKSQIENARVKFDKLIDDFELNVFKYEKFGRSFPKKLKVSPDSFLQVALQYAHYKVNGSLPVHVSIGSLRRFHKGRVDYIRGSNMSLLNFCESMSNKMASKEQKLLSLKKSVDTQTRVMLDTILGNGYDCHLTALKKIAEEEYPRLPSMFTDDVFDFNNKARLLASQVTTNFDGTFSCFGPNVAGGSTSTYNYKPNEILFTVAGLKSSSFNSVPCLTQAFEESLDEIFSIVSN